MRVSDDNDNEGYKLNGSAIPYMNTRRDGLMVDWRTRERR